MLPLKWEKVQSIYICVYIRLNKTQNQEKCQLDINASSINGAMSIIPLELSYLGTPILFKTQHHN